VDRLEVSKVADKKGILLISTLFFIVVLIMMSVALFALTRANYADMRSFYSENEAITNAESAINIASFIIASNPFLFTIDSNNDVNLGNLMNTSTTIIKKINSNNYKIAIAKFDSRRITVVSNDNTVGGSNFVINGNPSQIMAAIIISPRNKSIYDSGAILFFGNSTQDNNTYGMGSANAVGISFNNNKINFYFTSGGGWPSGATYPLYTSVNNVNNNVDITEINGYRNANKYTLLLMAMGYSKVPNTNKYVVRYVDQKLANGGLLSASLYTGGNASFTTTGTLNIIADQIKNNRLIANNFTVTLVDNNIDRNPKTIFSLTSESTSDVVGKLIATTDNNMEKNAKKYTVGESEPYSLAQLLDPSNNILDTVKEKTGGTVENKTISFNFDNTYNNFKNAVNSASQNAKTLKAGWYIFKDDQTIYYYPPDKKITDIIDVDRNLKDPGGSNKYEGQLTDSSGTVIATISDYSINFNPNVNVKFVNDPRKPAFVFITSFKEGNLSQLQPSQFGAYDVNINLNGNILQAQDLGFVVDGAFKGEGTVAVTGDGSGIGSTAGTQFYSFKYFDSSFSNPYDPTDVTSITNPLKKGTLVTRFDYLKSSSNKVAILVDNNMYINPTFQELNTSFMDSLLMESLQRWAASGYVNKVDPSQPGDKLDIFQVMTGFADSKFKLNGNDIKLWDVLFYSSNTSNTFNLKDGDFKDYKLSFNKSYKDFVFNDFNPALRGYYNNSNQILTISYGGYNVNINVSPDASGIMYTFSYGGKQVKLNYSQLPQSIANVINSNSGSVNFKDFAALWYSILRENPYIVKNYVSNDYFSLANAIKNNLGGSFNEYKAFIENNGLKSNPGKDALKDYRKIDKNYFAWIDMNQGGLTIGNGAAVKLGVQPGQDYSFLNKTKLSIIDSSNITDAKLEGMVVVKGKLKANTGAADLTFRGLALVKSDMNVKSNNTTFQFDLDSIDINLLAGSVINLVPILYRQESVISK
jgi:hypothetical protein